MRTSNPALRRTSRASGRAVDESNRATYKGVAVKTIYFAFVALFAAVGIVAALFLACAPLFDETAVITEAEASRFLWILGFALIGSVALTLIGVIGCAVSRKAVPVFGTIYALGEGLMIGVVSAFAELLVQGVVLAALVSTFVVFAVMSVLFFTGVIKVGRKFRSVLMTVLFSVVVISILFTLLALFVPAVQALLYNPAFAGISVLVSVGMVILASLFILFDLSLIKEAVDAGLDKSYEWYGAFGLTVTLLWLYMEFLRLFLKLAALFGRRR